jgi:hypothetical protein
MCGIYSHDKIPVLKSKGLVPKHDVQGSLTSSGESHVSSQTPN